MRFFKLSILSIALLLGLLSCSSESPFVSKEVIDELLASRNPFRSVGNIVAIIDNDIYYFAHVDSLPIRITQSPNVIKTDIKLSDAGDKFVYLDKNKTPVIMDITGNVLETLSEYSSVKQLGWTNNDKSLYFLVGNKVQVHGEQLEILQPGMGHYYDYVVSYSRNNAGDEAYVIYQYLGFAGRSGNRLQFYSEKNSIDTLFTRLNDESYEIGYIDFCGDNGDFIVGHTDFNGRIFQIHGHLNYQFYSHIQWSDEFIVSPVFNSEVEILIAGQNSASSVLQVLYFGDETYDRKGYLDTKVLDVENRENTSNRIYVDWVQK